ncbi:acid-sensing ion channel 2-like [Montipora foliosa]|uniref:acid-sensing ion channel 2-like n=1 Tax=Montipora foliosa TaxID=591990 RepID=UPI0035F1C698
MATIWKEFVSSTTVHGFRRIFESPSRFFRVIWLLLLLGATTGYVFFVMESIEKYFLKPVALSFTEVIPESGQLEFPAVTICNLNRFVKSKVDMFESDKNFYKLGLNLSACGMVGLVKKDMSCGQGLLCAFERFGSDVADNCNVSRRRRIIAALNNTKAAIFNAEEFLEAYGHDIDDMFLHFCRFGNGEICSPADFLPFLTENGRCFTFNSGRNHTPIRVSKRAGSFGGLSVMLDVQAHENTISEFSRGLRVIVHEQGAFVDIENGFNVLPGSHALLRISANKFIRLPSPYSSNCTKRGLPRIPRYTRNGCFHQCQANKTARMCGCRPVGVPVPLTLPVCSFQHAFCIEQSLASHNLLSCDCGVPCEKIQYATQVSYSEFPDDGVSRVLKYRFGYNKSIEYQRRNLVFLQLGFHHFGFLLQTEIPSYRLGSLMGDIGGNMGLFLGCSMLTLFEFVDLLWNLLRSKVNRIKGKSLE